MGNELCLMPDTLRIGTELGMGGWHGACVAVCVPLRLSVSAASAVAFFLLLRSPHLLYCPKFGLGALLLYAVCAPFFFIY